MFKKDSKLPKIKRFLISFLVLAFSGTWLFIFSAFLYAKFVELINMLASAQDLPVVVYGLGGAATVLVGILWLCAFVLFEIAKEELVSLARN